MPAPRTAVWVSDHTLGLPAWKESPEAVYVATMILLVGARYNSSLLAGDHLGFMPPPVEICHGPEAAARPWSRALAESGAPTTWRPRVLIQPESFHNRLDDVHGEHQLLGHVHPVGNYHDLVAAQRRRGGPGDCRRRVADAACPGYDQQEQEQNRRGAAQQARLRRAAAQQGVEGRGTNPERRKRRGEDGRRPGRPPRQH